jgi:DNA polymerase
MGRGRKRGQLRIARIELGYDGAMSELKDNPLAALAWLVEAGADEALLDAPVNRFAARTKPTSPLAGQVGRQSDGDAGRVRGPAPSEMSPARSASPRGLPPNGGGGFAPSAASDSDHIGRAMELAAAANSLAELKAALESFEGCGLKKKATHTVFADGTPSHRIMFIGEAPGRDEDRIGKPFVGRAGQLLDKMLASIGLDRSKNAYITNVLNWRPPDNRDPSPEEAAMCLPFLRRHIELAQPQIMILLGAVSARHVLGKTDGIMRLRGKWLEYHVNGKMVPVMPTLHPAYLLRQPAHKRLAWRDLQAIEDKIKSLGLLELSANAD